MQRKKLYTGIRGFSLMLMVTFLASCSQNAGTGDSGSSSAVPKKLSVTASAVTSSVSSASTPNSLNKAFFTRLQEQADDVPVRAQSSSAMSADSDVGKGKGSSTSNFVNVQTIGNANTNSSARSSSSSSTSGFAGTFSNEQDGDNFVFGSGCPAPSPAASLCGRDSFSYGTMVGGACPTFVCVMGLGSNDDANGILGN